MKWTEWMSKKAAQTVEWDELDPSLKQALGDFKSSMHAWSDAAMSRSHAVQKTMMQRSWRLATVWAMAVVLLMGGVSSGVIAHHRAEVQKQIVLERQKEEQQRQLAAERAKQEEHLLADVDNDLSRQVPQAMEPLAQLMNEYE